jgi:hypothetical protein
MSGAVHGMVRKTSVNTMFGRQATGVVQIALGTPASISKSWPLSRRRSAARPVA